MPSPYKRIGNHPRHPENPFVEQAIKDIKIVRRTKVARASNKAMQVIVNNDGEVTGHSQFLQYIEVDEEKFTKLYLSQFAAFWELSKPAIRVFGYIMTVMKPGQDRFIFRMDEAKEYTKYNQEVSIFNGLSQLIDCNIIARTKYDWEYFINPMVIFNGDRVTYTKTYIKKKKQQDPNQIPLFEGEQLLANSSTPLAPEATPKEQSGFPGFPTFTPEELDKLHQLIEKMRVDDNGKLKTIPWNKLDSTDKTE